MAHDEKLNQRIREILRDVAGISERNMFGGLCFLYRGHMLCGCDQKHGLSVRVGAQNYEAALKQKHAREMDFTGIPLKGLIFVDEEGYRNKTALKKWIDMGLAFTSTLPAKTAQKSAKKKTVKKKTAKKKF